MTSCAACAAVARPSFLDMSTRRLPSAFGLVVLLGGAFAWWFAPQAWTGDPRRDLPEVRIDVPAGSDAEAVGRLLESRGIAMSGLAYRMYALYDRSAERPKAGVYRFFPATPFRDIAKALAIGPEREEASVTVVEGRTIADIAKQMGEMGVDPEAYVALVGDPFAPRPFDPEFRKDFPWLSVIPNGKSLEGFLFPDTYRVWKDQLPNSLVAKQLAEFRQKTEEWDPILKKQRRTLWDAVILASIVEKEVAKPEDRRVVAGIFWGRIEDRMRLQSDATVNYVLRTGRTRPTHDDIAVDSPFNTYKVDGLPPAPISNPSFSALEAAVFPAQTEYRYFLTDPEGKAYFARTFEEHKRNRQKAFGE